MHTSRRRSRSRWDDDGYRESGVVADSVIGLARDPASARLEAAGDRAGRDRASIPGVDFGKTPAQSVELLRAFARITATGQPVMSAVSRKDFVGALTGRRALASASPARSPRSAGPSPPARSLIRAHDVAETRDFLAVLGALSGGTEVPAELADRRGDPARASAAAEPDAELGRVS